MTKLAPFDAADYLDDEETIAEYLTAALEDPNSDVFLASVRDIARARGMTQPIPADQVFAEARARLKSQSRE
jgi:probable addiction module antidote protein